MFFREHSYRLCLVNGALFMFCCRLVRIGDEMLYQSMYIYVLVVNHGLDVLCSLTMVDLVPCVSVSNIKEKGNPPKSASCRRSSTRNKTENSCRIIQPSAMTMQLLLF